MLYLSRMGEGQGEGEPPQDESAQGHCSGGFLQRLEQRPGCRLRPGSALSGKGQPLTPLPLPPGEGEGASLTPATTFAGRSVALFGLGGSGLATALALKAGGARVIACDDSAAAMAQAQGQGIETGDLKSADWSGFAALVLAPGVPLTHPEPHWSVRLARAAGVEIIGDIELFCREREKIAPDAPFIAITGTNGKSTTTALIAHLLRSAGRDVQLGGNIGTAILSLEPPRAGRAPVIEGSAFQIDLAPTIDPLVGVLVNLSEDHLDRHGD